MGWEGWRGVESGGVEFVERGSRGWEGWGEGVVWELRDGDERRKAFEAMITRGRTGTFEDHELLSGAIDHEVKVLERAQD